MSYPIVVGQTNPTVPVMPIPIVQNRAPINYQDTGYPPGQPWLYKATDTWYLFNADGTWSNLSAASLGYIQTINGNAAIANNYVLAGTANQINDAETAGTSTLSLSSTLVLPGTLTVAGTTSINATGAANTTIGTGGTGFVHIGNATGNTQVTGSLTASTSLTATAGAITATNGNLVLGTAGNKLSIATGANASVGVTAAMSGTPGTISVSTTACTTSSVILYSRATVGGTPGNVSISAQSNGSFTLLSTGNETSTFNYLIIN